MTANKPIQKEALEQRGGSGVTHNRALWFRVEWSDSGSRLISEGVDESEVKQKIAQWWSRNHFACHTLGLAVDSLKRTIDYNGLYNAFLLGQISEEDFESESGQYVVKHDSSSPDLVYYQIQTLLDFTKSEFTCSEIADIFRVTEDVVDDAVEQLSLNFTGPISNRLVPSDS